MKKNNLIFIGMPAVGKSTVGVVVAKRLGKNFIDTDLLIQEQEKKLLREIIAEVGEDGFLEKVSCPAIVVQAKDDAVADPESAGKIFDRIASERKELYTPDYGEHNIVLTEGRHEAFRKIAMFLESL